MPGDLLTPAVVEALKDAGPEVAEAVGLDVAGAAITAAAGVEAGLNPLADGGAVLTDAAAAAKDVRAAEKVAELAKAVIESPAGKAALKATGETAEAFMKRLEVEGPKVVKELLERAESHGLKEALQSAATKAIETWKDLPAVAKGAIGAVGVGLAGYAKGLADTTVIKSLTDTVTDAYNERFHHPQCAPEGSDRFQDLDKKGLSGRVIGQDGSHATLQVGRERYSISNLSETQLAALKPGEYVNIRPTEGGRAEVDPVLTHAQTPTPAVGHGRP